MKISWGNIIAIIVVVMVLNVWFRVFFPLDDDSSFIWFAMSEFTLFVSLIGVTLLWIQAGRVIMGGNALTEVDTVRLDKLDYEYVTHLIVNKVKLAYPDVTIQPTASYRNKPDFGDADIVLHWDNQKSLVEVVQELFSPTQIVKNGNVISFDYDNFQIDFIYFTDFHTYDFAWCYFAWNDLGNFLGRISRRINLKLGHDGLWYTLRDDDVSDRVVKDILVTRNFHEALTILGYAPHIWFQGFDSPEDIYQYVTTSKYFHPAGFVLSNRNYTSRVRDRKRQMYNGLLAWMGSEYGIDENTPLPDDYYSVKGDGLEIALENYPKFAMEYHAAVKEHELNKALCLKINGTWAKEFFGVEGKPLGVKLKCVRRYLDVHGLKEWVAFESPEIVYGLIKLLASEGRFDEKEVQQTRSSGV